MTTQFKERLPHLRKFQLSLPDFNLVQKGRPMADVAIENNFIPRGVAHYAIPYCAKTQQVVFLLVPKFSMAAFSAAIEPLRIANQLTEQPLYQWSIISEDGAPVRASKINTVSSRKCRTPISLTNYMAHNTDKSTKVCF